jgi:hypothetical protein
MTKNHRHRPPNFFCSAPSHPNLAWTIGRDTPQPSAPGLACGSSPEAHQAGLAATPMQHHLGRGETDSGRWGRSVRVATPAPARSGTRVVDPCEAAVSELP